VRFVLTPVAGIREVWVDITGRQVHVGYDDAAVDVDRMKAILQAEEYPVESIG